MWKSVLKNSACTCVYSMLRCKIYIPIKSLLFDLNKYPHCYWARIDVFKDTVHTVVLMCQSTLNTLQVYDEVLWCKQVFFI